MKRDVAEFFAGIGLMRLGLERQGWNVVFANDIDPAKFEMYREHFPGARDHFLIDDIHRIDAANIPEVELATASFPCNDLSLAGSRKGLRGRQSSSFWGFIRILNEWGDRRPPLILIENVPGFLTSRQGEDFKAALKSLNKLGYAVDAFMLDAANFVPQSRVRLFVIGSQSGASRVEREEQPARPATQIEFKKSQKKSIRWSFHDLPPLPQRSLSLEDMLENLPDDSPEWWDEMRGSYLLSQMNERHREVADEMIAGKRWSYGTVFRRMRAGKSMAELRTDGVAGCLRTPRGGSGRQILFKAGRGQYRARLITPREAARLMGAGDFRLNGASLNQALFGFGDAVCVPVIEWIATHVLQPTLKEMT
jgi:DNA (cytosine-5)-methyltransferase 1